MINNSSIFRVILLMVAFLFISTSMSAQEVEMADKLRSDGKIYVVVIVVCIIFAGIVTYLALLDKKISSIEKRIKGE